MGLPFVSGQKKKRDQIVAVDLGAHTTKAVYLQRRGENFSLLNYAVVESPTGDKPLSVDVLAEHLRGISRALGGLKAKPVTLALGVTDTVFRQLELPLMPIADMRLMLKYNSKSYLQQDLADHVFDCNYVVSARAAKPAEGAKPGGTAKQKVMVGGARKQVIDDLQAAVKAAGLIADQVVPSLVGPTNAFEIAEPEVFAKEVVALVDLGYKNTSITILDCGDIMLNRVVNIGGDNLTNGLAEMLSISYAEAEGIKVGMAAEVQANLEPHLSPLARELRASLDFFEHQQDRTATQVFVSGGSARSEFVVQVLQNELLVPCKSWNPARSLELSLDPQKMGEVEQVAPQLTVAVGAAATAF